MLQNHLKAVFVGMYMTGNVALFLMAVYKLISEGNSLAWIGAAVASGAVSCLIGLYYGGWLPRTTRHIPLLLVATTLGTALAGIGLMNDGEVQTANLPFLAALVLSLVGTLAYLYWYSILGRPATKALHVGEMLPVLDLADETGQAVRIDSLFGNPLLLVFYRGNWCPLCMAQVRELANQCQEFQQRGVTVALISPQPQNKSAKLAMNLGVSFKFLVDKEGKAARKLGISHIAGLPLGLQVFGYNTDTVFPTVIVTDTKGKIVFVDQTENYRVRPGLEVLLGALQN
ncbi:peroxiredoxin family protein [Sulfurirhabdus autotrophica]|uniref:thioredoxin-dependent peroxiredoxin n=1 Tax=Sulfurirhabdus autotrophica TaxID=1706046 RepID=A0A4R3Y4V1_9PROT|nr:peroxiredoxin family protein [Sulfurirhabdus autotrophica]TCV85828.1 peroxiredoxin [Sulfurirhabdus autotrophica]